MKKINIKSKKLLILVAVILTALTTAFASMQFTNKINPVSEAEKAAMTYEELEEEDIKTQSDNVEFSAFFTSDLNHDGYAEKVNGSAISLGYYDTLYANLKVSTAGYLRDGRITLNGENVSWKTAIVADNIVARDYIGETSDIQLVNEIHAGSQRLFSGQLSSIIGNNVNDYSKVNSMRLTGTYVDDHGIETPIDVTREFIVDWYGSVSTQIVSTSQQLDVTKNGATMQVRFNVSVKERIGQLLLKDLNVEVTAPELNGYKAIEGSVVSNLSQFDPETGVLSMAKESRLDPEGNLMGKFPYLNTYTVILTYPIEAHGDDIPDGKLYTQIDVPVKATYTAYNNQKEGFTNIVSSTAQDTIRLVEEKGVPVPKGDSANIYIGKQSGTKYVISKESAINAYNGNESEDETYEVRWKFEHYNTKTDGNITLIETRSDEGKTKANGSFDMMDYATIDGIYFHLAGQTGGINVYNEETGDLIHTFTNADINSYSNFNPYKLEDGVKKIRVEVSNLTLASTLEVYQIKKISNEALVTNVPRNVFNTYNGVYTYLKTSGANYGSPSYYSAFANYSEQESVVSMKMTPSTVKTNELSFNQSITITTSANEYNQMGWQDGVFLIEIPEQIIAMENLSVSGNVEIIGYDYYKENGKYFVKILTQNDTRKTYSITASYKAYIDPLAVSANAGYTLYAYNKDCNNYANPTTDRYDINNNNNKSETVGTATTYLNIVAPQTVLISQTTSDYDEENNVTIAPNVADVRKERRTANINLNILNNEALQISETKILGVVPFVGNKYISSGENLNSDYTATMTEEGIKVPYSLRGKVTVYYSENCDADKDLDKEENLWTTTPSDWTKVKKYLIDFGNNTLPSGQKHTFTYAIQLPEGLEYNQISYSEYMMYYALNTAGGKLTTELEPSKLGVRIARKYDIDIAKLNKENGKPVSGATYELRGYDRLGAEFSKRLVTTNTEGKLIVRGLYVDNTYELQEVNSPENYELNPDINKFKVTENSQGNLVVTVLSENTFKIAPFIEDDVLKATVEDTPKYKIIVTKIDSNTQEPIKGVKFYVNKVDKTYTTDAEGKTELKPLAQNVEYKLKELNAFGYYLIDDITFKVEKQNNEFKVISDNEIFANARVEVKEGEDLLSAEVTIEDERQPSILIKKTNKTTGEPISDVRFSVDGRIGSVYATDENGEVLIGGFAENQDYTLRETKAVGYYLQTVNFKIVRDANNNLKIESENEEFANATVIDENRKILQVDMTNEEIETYNLEIIKISEGAEHFRLEGARFNLASDDENTVKEYISDENGQIFATDLYTFVQGKSVTGVYTLQETKAPEGYSNNAEQIKFKLVKTEEGYEVEIINKNVVKTVKSATYENGTVRLVIEDKPMFTLTKVDQETGKPLANVGFIIMDLSSVPPTYAKDVNGNYVGELNLDGQYVVTTDENGKIRLPLKDGKYAVIEAIFPEGYYETDYMSNFTVSTGETGDDDTLIKDIKYVEDLVEFSRKVNNYNSYKGKEVNLLNTLDFNEDSSYRNPEDISYGDINEDGVVEGIKVELTKETGKGFIPIGSWNGTCFEGTFNGNNNEIRNLYINREGNVGLFSYVVNATIRDLGVTGKIISEYGEVGAIVGKTNGSIYSNDGENGQSLITNCYNKATITIEGGRAGGIAGFYSGDITYCHNEGNISSSGEAAAGIVGQSANRVQILHCYNNGDISCKNDYSWGYASGILAHNGNYPIIMYCYNTGNISLETYQGECSGILGYDRASYCYNTGTITAKKKTTYSGYRVRVGGISSYHAASYSYSVGEVNALGGAIERTGAGTYYTTDNTTLDYMKTPEFINDINGENRIFRQDTENVNSGYPVFIWQHGDIEGQGGQGQGGQGQGGQGQEDNIDYVESISTIEDLTKFANQVNSGVTYEGRTVTLENSLDLTGVNFTPIGFNSDTYFYINTTYKFKGTFDGQGNKIENLNINKPDNNGIGLFGVVESATIKNLEVSGNITGAEYVGGIVGYADKSTVENCTNNATITGNLATYTSGSYSTTYGGYVGGITGYGNDINCTNNGTISADTNSIGGIAGRGTATNCTNNAQVTGLSEVGGIVGRGSATGCTNNENITGYSRIGGISGYTNYDDGNVSNCINNGIVKGQNEVGGIAGFADDIDKCTNKGNVVVEGVIDVESYPGGIGGIAGRANKIISCHNEGNISATGTLQNNGQPDRCGRIAGIAGNATNINKSYNTGDITANITSLGNKVYVSGIVAEGSVICCYNTGDIDVASDGEILASGISNKSAVYCYNIGDVVANTSTNNAKVGTIISDEDTQIVKNYYSEEIQLTGDSVIRKGTAKSSDYMKSDDFINEINQYGYKKDTENINNGYPIINEEIEPGTQNVEIEYIEDLVDLSDLVNMTNALEYTVTLTRSLDFNNSDSYRDFEDQSRGDINGDGIIQGIKDELTNTNGIGFIPIGNNDLYPFKGTFDGQGHKLENIYINRNEGNYAGLFGYAVNPTIRNLEISGNVKFERTGSSYSQVGSIIGKSDGNLTIENCISNVNITSTESYVGMIAYAQGNNGKIKNCVNNGNITGDNFTGGIIGDSNITSIELLDCVNNGTIKGNYETGGICGYNQGSEMYINNCQNTGYIDGNQYVGGILGSPYGNITIENSFNTGNIDCNGYSGGLCGYTGSAYINANNCYNSGDVTVREGSSWGTAGIIGTCGTCNVTNCYNTGKITSTDYAAGIVGCANGNISNCYNKGEIILRNGYSNGAGGIAGQFSGSIEFCYNEGKITVSISNSSTSRIGGIVGNYNYYNQSTFIDNCYNIADIDVQTYGNAYIGGIVGSNCVVKNSYNLGNINYDSNRYAYIGGILGYTGSLENVYNKGNITIKVLSSDYCYAGGLFGMSADVYSSYNEGDIDAACGAGYFCGIGYGSVYNSYNTGNINVIPDESYTGSIYLQAYGVTYASATNCYNTGNINLFAPLETSGYSNYAYAGGVAGNSAINCYNTGDINIRANNVYAAAGIVGGSGNAENCYNTGNITCEAELYAYAGGISSGGKAKNCYNTGDVDSKLTLATTENADYDLYSGGIVGNGSAEDCYNTGKVKGTIVNAADGNAREAHVGGISGCYSGDIKNCYSLGDVEVTTQNARLANAGRITGDIGTEVAETTNYYLSSQNLSIDANNEETEVGIKVLPQEIPLDSIDVIDIKSVEFYNLINENEVWTHIEGYEPKLFLNTLDQTDGTHVRVTNKIQKFDITTDIDETTGRRGGTITGEDEPSYETIRYGEANKKEIKMTPYEGYKISKITVNGEPIAFETAEDGTFTMGANYFTNVQEDKHVVVTFVLAEQVLTINKVDIDTQEPLQGAKFKVESATTPNELLGKLTNNGDNYFEDVEGKLIPNNVNGGSTANSYIPIDLRNKDANEEYYVVLNVSSYAGTMVAQVSEDTAPITTVNGNYYSTDVFMNVNGGSTQNLNYTSHVLQGGKMYYLKIASTPWGAGSPYDSEINSVRLFKNSEDKSNIMGELTANNETRTFVKSGDTIELSSGTEGTEGANAYVEIDLTNRAGTYNVILDTDTTLFSGSIFKASMTDSTAAVTNYSQYNQFVYVNKDTQDKYVSEPLEGGSKYYLQLAYTGGNVNNEVILHSMRLVKSDLVELFYNNNGEESTVIDENKYLSKLIHNPTGSSDKEFILDNGKYVNESGNPSTGYIEIDLTNKEGKYNVLVDAETVQTAGPLVATITNSTTSVTDGSPYGRLIYLSGTTELGTYSSRVLEGGQKYYLQFRSLYGGSPKTARIGKIQLVENETLETFDNSQEGVIGQLTNNGEYYFEYTDGKLVANNIQSDDTALDNANSYIPIDLGAKQGKYAVVIKSRSKSPTIAATVVENTGEESDKDAITNIGGNYYTNNVFMWVNGGAASSGATPDHTYVSKPLDGGKSYYLKLASESRKEGEDYEASIDSIEIIKYTDLIETFKNNKGDKFTATDLVTDENGQIKLTVPHIGRYVITETEVPDGYTLLKTPTVTTVTSSGSNTVKVDNKSKQKVLVHHYFKNAEGEYTQIKVADDEETLYDVGDNYTTAPKIDLKNLELEKKTDGTYKIPENASGIVSETGNEVTYYYEEKKIELNIHHYLEGTEQKLAEDETQEYNPTVTVKDDEVVEVSTEQTYEVKSNSNFRSLLFRNYTSTAITQDNDLVDQDQVTFNDNSELTYYYDMLQGTVTAKYVDQVTGREIEERVTTQDTVGNLYEVTQKTIDGYTFIERDGDLTGTYKEEETVVTFYYRKNTKVTVNHIDRLAETLLDTEEVLGVEGDEFTSSSKNFQYYVLVQAPANETVTMTAQEIVLNYYYEKVTVGLLEKHVDLATGGILYNKTYTLRAGDTYKIDPKEFTGYDLVESRLPTNAEGTIRDQAVEVVYYYSRQMRVVAKYIDKETNQSLADDVVQEGHEGDRYTTQSKTIADYELIKIPENATGTMTPTITQDGVITTIVVKYEYRKAKVQSPGVIEKHIDIATNRLLEPATTYTGFVGDVYVTTPKTFDGYDLVESRLPTNAEGTMSEELIEIDYYYTRKIKVVVKYEDTDSKVKLADDIEINGHVGDNYTTQTKEFAGYELSKVPENAEGVMDVVTEVVDGQTVEKTTITVTYEYKKIAATVIEKHYDIKSNELLGETTYDGKVGDNYETTAKAFRGYDIVSSKLPKNSKGKMTKDPIEVKYYYIKKVTLTVEFKDKKTEEDIKDPEDVNLHEDDSYKPIPKPIDGYDVVEIPNNGKDITVKEDGTVVFYYKRKAVVEVKYLDKETGKELFDTVVINGHEGDTYTTEEKQIEYYDLIEKPTNATGVMQVKKVKEDGKEKVDNTTKVVYYYKAKDFNMKIDKEITKITIDGNKKRIGNGKLAKLEIHRKKLDESDVTVEYTIKVSNIGEITGGTTIEEDIPSGFTADKKENSKWTIKDGKARIVVKDIKPGEEKKYTIVLKWNKGEKNIGTKTNTAKVVDETNKAGFKDSNEKDNTSSAVLLLTVSTGEEGITQYVVAVLLLASTIVVVILTRRRK